MLGGIMMEQWNEMTLNHIKSIVLDMSEKSRVEACNELLLDSRKGVVAFAVKTLKQIEKMNHERARLQEMWLYENEATACGYQYIVGTDEVGRGPLAGPVVAAAVILPPDFEAFGINDSKKLSENKRNELDSYIKYKALAYSIQEVSVEDIDRLNILHAAELAMKQAVQALPFGDICFIDGENQLNLHIPTKNIIKGDSRSVSIAAASIIAKVYRDQLMVDYEKLYPEYGFAKHKGYGTAEHYEALHQYGPSPIHRRSFRLN